MHKGNCQKCGHETEHPCITHCSDKCLLASVQNSKSVSGIPVETWDDAEFWM